MMKKTQQCRDPKRDREPPRQFHGFEYEMRDVRVLVHRHNIMHPLGDPSIQQQCDNHYCQPGRKENKAGMSAMKRHKRDSQFGLMDCKQSLQQNGPQ